MGNLTPVRKMCHDISLDTQWRAKRAAEYSGILMAHFGDRREIGVKFPMRAASVDPKNTQHMPLTILFMTTEGLCYIKHVPCVALEL